MKKIYTMLVVASDCERMEKSLNMFHVGLNDWDKSKAFKVADTIEVVNYTILCDDETFTSVTEVMNGTRVF